MIVLVFLIAGGAIVATAYFAYGRNGGTTTILPQGCTKPAGGFLIVAGANGFNDSVDQSVPKNHWPVIGVQAGANVTIRVCNVDNQPHGFQISHYYDSKIVAMAPGQILNVHFVADQTGTFQIYCDIFCTIHWAMISGRLTVS